MGWDAPWHWVILALIVVALFGYKKLPEMSRSVARSLRVFRTEMRGLSDDDAARQAHANAQQPTYPPAAPPAPYPPAASQPAGAPYPSAVPAPDFQQPQQTPPSPVDGTGASAG